MREFGLRPLLRAADRLTEVEAEAYEVVTDEAVRIETGEA